MPFTDRVSLILWSDSDVNIARYRRRAGHYSSTGTGCPQTALKDVKRRHPVDAAFSVREACLAQTIQHPCASVRKTHRSTRLPGYSEVRAGLSTASTARRASRSSGQGIARRKKYVAVHVVLARPQWCVGPSGWLPRSGPR